MQIKICSLLKYKNFYFMQAYAYIFLPYRNNNTWKNERMLIPE